MAQLTTLQIVQRVLSMVDSENVSSIDETIESEQVKVLVDLVYESMLDDYPWNHLRENGTLEVTSTPNLMKIPDDVLRIDGDLIRYDKKNVWWISTENMTRTLDGRDTTASNVDSSGALTDRDPLYWTSYDDVNITFDSYDGSLVSALTNVELVKQPTTLSVDTDVPDLPDSLHTVLIYGVLEEAFRTLKGDDSNAERYRRKYLVGLSKAKRYAKKVDRKPSTNGVDFGRKITTIARRNLVTSSKIVEGS